MTVDDFGAGKLIGFMREETEDHDFLVTIRPLLPMCIHTFDTVFLRINTLRHDEVTDILKSKTSLQELSFLVMLKLPLAYLREHVNC